jgi:hypothetical protein
VGLEGGRSGPVSDGCGELAVAPERYGRSFFVEELGGGVECSDGIGRFAQTEQRRRRSDHTEQY